MKDITKLVSLLAGSLISIAATAQSDTQGRTTGPEALPHMSAPSAQAGRVFVPDSSKPQARGVAHTTYVLRSVDGGKPAGAEFLADELIVSPEGTVQTAETPCSLGHLYVNSPSSACSPSFNSKGGPSEAGYGAIALVDAFDNPNAASDLAAFSAHFGLPAAKFTKIYANGNGSCTTPPQNDGWALEESLDIEWAHVFAPAAEIVLVEACSSSVNDLVYAEQTAFRYIVANYPAGGQVSNSWAAGEFAGQTSLDADFADFTYNSVSNYAVPILAFASSGDDGAGVSWPSSDPWVVAAGGSSVMRNSNLSFSSEACWSGSGGGISTVESYATTFTGGNTGPWANFQYPIYGQAFRAVPDMSFDADPASGVYVLSQVNGGWYIVGGTSVSSPSLASIVNRANNRLGSVHINSLTGGANFATAENDLLYAQMQSSNTYAANFYDVKSGSNGDSAEPGYDLCTGVGTPRGLNGK